MKHTAARLAQLEKRRPAEREVASSNPGPSTKVLKKTGEITLAQFR